MLPALPYEVRRALYDRFQVRFEAEDPYICRTQTLRDDPLWDRGGGGLSSDDCDEWSLPPFEVSAA